MKFTRHRLAAALFAACCATSACAAGAAGAQGPDGHRGGPEGGPHDLGGHGPGMPGPEMPFGPMHGLRRLNLSEAQQDKLFAIMHAAAPERREHEKAIRKAHQALRELGRAERFDDARATALSRELGQAVAAAALQQARVEAQVLALLTPEQRDRLRRHRTPGPQVRPGQGPRDGAEGRRGEGAE